MSQPVTLAAPASKSLSHRYLIGAALANGRSTVRNVLESRDLAQTRAILQAVGAGFEPVDGGWTVTGVDGQLKGGTTPDQAVSCDVHESGTTCRLLTAVLSTGRGFFRIHGAPRMHQRPMGEIAEAIARLGCGVCCEESPGRLPILLEARGIDPARCGGVAEISMDDSSQYFSGMLLAAPLAPTPLAIELVGGKAVSWPYVGLTLTCLADFSINFAVETRPSPQEPWRTLPEGGWRELGDVAPGTLRVSVRPGSYRAGDFTVEGDWSGASYFLAAGAAGPRPVEVTGLAPDSLQADRSLVDILRRMGAKCDMDGRSVRVSPSSLKGIDVDMGHCPDLVPTVAVLAAFAEGVTRIGNVAHLRIKESDRISAPVTELRKAGIRTEETRDGLAIHGVGPGRPVLPSSLSTHNDHRMAMSLALLGLGTGEAVDARMDAPQVVSKSFPDFWDRWRPLQ
ncbi:MAG: 3-phosphoshikimate 1-carboxyvinyltransferase [Desulfovibrio sp.]|nr:3-phosphoshikimate 1-carboxyvinyltransferase [Desulfovibrio sp.]